MIVQLVGGAGNQMFGLAFGLSMGAKRGEEVFFTRNQVDGNIHGGYALGGFSINPNFVPKLEPPYYQEPHFQFDPEAINAPRDWSFIGYWQSEKYHDPSVIRKSFGFKSEALSEAALDLGSRILDEDTAFIHVRRGDYLKEPHRSYHGVLSLDYYKEGIQRIRQTDPYTKFFVFSDDPEWCVHNFPDFEVVGGFTPLEDMWLMSCCKHAIIANSSFSWWAARLGENDRGIIIAPQRWFLAPVDTSDLIPERWVRLAN